MFDWIKYIEEGKLTRRNLNGPRGMADKMTHSGADVIKRRRFHILGIFLKIYYIK